MLTGVTIKNFRCLRDVTIQLEPLTIVVGPNAAGKSTLLRALDPNFRASGPQDFWQSKAGNFARTFRFADQAPITFTDRFDSSGAIHQESRPTPPFVYQFLQLDPSSLRKSIEVREERILARDGSNLANVIATLSRRQQELLASDFARLVPVYADVNPRPLQIGHQRLVFQDRWQNSWYEPANVSDGSLIVLALLTLSYQEPSPDLIVIEEVERGLHPYLIGEILTVLRKMTRGEVGNKAVQVVIATHSAELLEFAAAQEVRFLSRTDEGGVILEEAPTSTPDWPQVVKDHQGSLGNLWLSGGLGGVPGGIGT